ncbi:hypothetical protein MPSEU_000675000 [Mayamaea pseudoterrestris]|nr:hypothetical protein MPSEU_000675000 [Mayamaea pseudoterrestris]
MRFLPSLLQRLSLYQIPMQQHAWSQIAVRNFASKKHKNLLKYAKGYRGRSKNCFRIAIRRIEKAWQYAYRDRKRRKREWRKLWIMRLQAASRLYGYGYSRMIPALKQSHIQLNRKVLAEIAANEPFAFYSIVRVIEATNAGLERRPTMQHHDENQDMVA